MTNIDEFNRRECGKIDSNCVNAYTDFKLDPDSATGLCLDTSWGGDCLDLTSIVKAAETVTTLYLSPEDNPNCLVFEREDGQSDCINGDDLSRIIHGNQRYLHEFNAQLHGVIVDFMDLPLVTHYPDKLATHDQEGGVADLRGRIAMKRPDSLPIANVPYYQMWQGCDGFKADLSILDLMMNMGRESVLTLIGMTKGI